MWVGEGLGPGCPCQRQGGLYGKVPMWVGELGQGETRANWAGLGVPVWGGPHEGGGRSPSEQDETCPVVVTSEPSCEQTDWQTNMNENITIPQLRWQEASILN